MSCVDTILEDGVPTTHNELKGLTDKNCARKIRYNCF